MSGVKAEKLKRLNQPPNRKVCGRMGLGNARVGESSGTGSAIKPGTPSFSAM
jgi:hypothetical protein